MENKKVSVDGLTWRKPGGRYVDEIFFEELTDDVIEKGSDKDVVSLFTMLGESVWRGAIDAKRINAYELLDRLKPVVEDLLVGAGWEVRIVDPLKRTGVEDYLHSAGYTVKVHEVPFSAELNIELRLDELCDTSGSIRTKEETLALLKERIGVEAYDLSEIYEEDMDYVLAIMGQEELGLEDLHDVNGQELTTGAQEFRWFIDSEEAEQEARDYLTDDPELWQGAVAAGNTTDGLDGWVEDILKLNGWAEIICSYDGLERAAQLKGGTWFPYIRTN